MRSLRTEPSSCERLALGWALLASTLGLSRPVGAEPAAPPVAAPESTPQAPAPSAPVVSFAELLAYAEQHAPALRLARAQRGYAAAERLDAGSILADNPELEVAVGPRLSGGQRDVDVRVALEQPLEIAGQSGLRREAAGHVARRLDAELARARWQLERELGLAYRLATVAAASAELAAHSVAFAEEVAQVARARLAAGDASIIDVRVAESDAARARQAALAAEQALAQQRFELCALSGWPASAPPRVGGALTAPEPVPALATLMAAAERRHPTLAVQRAARAEAEARRRVAAREAWPLIGLGVEWTREGGLGGSPTHVVLGTLSVPLPLWQRNEPERERAAVDASVARVELDAATLAARVEASAAHAALVNARERVELLERSVTAPLEDTLGLLRRGFAAGELPLLDVLSARERLLAARRDTLDAYADYYQALAVVESLQSGAPRSANGAANASEAR